MLHRCRQWLGKGCNWIRKDNAGMMDSLITDLILWIFASTAVGFIAGMLWGALNTDIQAIVGILQNLF